MSMTMQTQPPTGSAARIIGCPFYAPGPQNCQAASHLWPLDAFSRAGLCGSDDYDDCPLYLCQALRSSRSLGPARESLAMGGK